MSRSSRSVASAPLPAPRELRRPPSADSFQFAHIIGSEMCAAEDVFLRGRLLPYKPSSPFPTTPAPPSLVPPPAEPSRRRERRKSSCENYDGHRRAGSSSDGLERGKKGAAARYRKPKGCRSDDYQRLRSVVGPAVPGARPAAPAQRPKWYMVMFGSVTVPAELDMKSVRSRMGRRSSSVVCNAGCGRDCRGGGGCGPQASTGGAAWKVLRSLSCSGDV